VHVSITPHPPAHARTQAPTQSHPCTRPQVLIDSRYKNVYGGRATNDSEITGLLIAILFAGQHTSSVTSSWTGYRMLSNRKWFEVRAPRCTCRRLWVAQSSIAGRSSGSGGGGVPFCLRGCASFRLLVDGIAPAACTLCPLPLTVSRPLLPASPPHYVLLQAAQEEQRRVMREHGDKLDMDVLNSMDTLHLNIQVRCGWWWAAWNTRWLQSGGPSDQQGLCCSCPTGAPVPGLI